MKKCFYLLLLTWILAACSSQTKETKNNVLKASLKETEVSLKDLFSRIEVIPLETNDTALMDHVHRIRKVNNKYYILNEDYPGFQYINILVYDAEGNFLQDVILIVYFSDSMHMIHQGRIVCFQWNDLDSAEQVFE